MFGVAATAAMTVSDMQPAELPVEKPESVQLDHAQKPEGMQMVEINPELEKRVLRKMDKAIMPLVTALCEQLCNRASVTQLS